jgi:hypothetical protein
VHFTHKNRSLLLCPRTVGCLRIGRTKHGLSKSSPDPCPVPIQPYCRLHLLALSRPGSQLRSTKPKPILTCGCTGKLPGMKYSSISLILGEAFRKMSWRFPMNPGVNHWIPQAAHQIHPSPSSVYWILVSSLEVLRSWRCSPWRCHLEDCCLWRRVLHLTPLTSTHTNPCLR